MTDVSDPILDDPAPNDQDVDAAEYVLGLLPPDQARAMEALALNDRAVAASIVAWQNRLTPLTQLVVAEFPPPELWQRLALATGLQPPARRPRRRSLSEKIWRSLALWRGTTVVGLAIASALAALLLSGEQGPPVTLMAALSPPGTAGPAFLIRVGELGQTVVAPLARVNTPLNRSLELWAVNDGSSTPVSLGLMPGGGRIRLRVPVRQGTRLLVSQEPTGGSPTGVPTGPVVLSGVLTGG